MPRDRGWTDKLLRIVLGPGTSPTTTEGAGMLSTDSELDFHAPGPPRDRPERNSTLRSSFPIQKIEARGVPEDFEDLRRDFEDFGFDSEGFGLTSNPFKLASKAFVLISTPIDWIRRPSASI